MVRWVDGWFIREILPLFGSIFQAGTSYIFSFAENPGWNPALPKNFEMDTGHIPTLKMPKIAKTPLPLDLVNKTLTNFKKSSKIWLTQPMFFLAYFKPILGQSLSIYFGPSPPPLKLKTMFWSKIKNQEMFCNPLKILKIVLSTLKTRYSLDVFDTLP